jgi:tetratricopeptide (TPR) repeat protein
MAKKEYDKARADFNKALDLGPKDPEALNAKAWFLAVCPDDQYRDKEQALELAKKACEATRMRDWTHIDTLAAAHAINGQFSEAIGVQEKALEMAPDNKKETCRQRLELYQNQKPYLADSRL